MRRLTIVLTAVALVAFTAAPASAQPDKQATDVLAFDEDLTKVGDATLVRSGRGVVAHVKAHNIPAGVYTLWWVVWNTPEGCATPFQCLEPDLFDPEGDTGLAIGYGGGAVVGPGGNLSLSAQLKEGRALEGFPYAEFGAIGVSLTETTLVDSEHAEIHLVLRTHGELIPGMVWSQRSTFNGGCVYEPPISASDPAWGVPGANACSDEYFAIFPSINTP